jgi:hypothetical protein
MFVLRIISLGILTILIPATASAGSARDELLRIMPKDITFAFLVQNLGAQCKALNNSPFLAQLQKVPLGKAILLPQDPGEAKTIEELFKDFDITPEVLVYEIMGDAFLFAYQDPPVGKGGDGQGIFLVHSKNPKKLASLLEKIDAYQIRTGDLQEIKLKEYAKRTYVQRVKKNPTDGDEFYFLRDNLLVFATNEDLLKVAIDQDLTQPLVEKQIPPLSKHFQNPSLDSPLFVWWMNPRAFDAEMKQLIQESKGFEKGFLTHFQTWWRAMDGIGIHFDMSKSIELGITLRVDQDKLPTSGKLFFSEFIKPSALWQIIPEDALLALATRIEGAPLIELLGGFVDAEYKPQLQEAIINIFRNFGPEQLAILQKGLGPDFGMWIFHPSEQEPKKGWFPQILCAFKLRSSSEGIQAEQALNVGFTSLAMLARLIDSRMMFHKVKDENNEITYLIHDHKFPSGFSPSFTSKGGYFVISASPNTIKRFSAPKNEAIKQLSETPLLRISLIGWKKYLDQHRDSIADYFGMGNESATKEINKQLGTILQNLDLFDRLELNQKVKGDQVSLLLRLRTTQPLQK